MADRFACTGLQPISRVKLEATIQTSATEEVTSPKFRIFTVGFKWFSYMVALVIPGPRILPKNNGEKSVKSVKIIFLHR